MTSDHIQDDPAPDYYPAPSNYSTARGTKGNRPAQAARYRSRYRGRLLDYARRYAAARRLAGRLAASSDE